MKKNNGFFLVSLSFFVAVGAVCCVAITAKAHKVTIREMRDKAVTETIKSAKEIGSNLKQSLKTNVSYCMDIVRHGNPRLRKAKATPPKEEDQKNHIFQEGRIIKPIVFCLRSIENLSYERNVFRLNQEKLNKLHDASEEAFKVYFPSERNGLLKKPSKGTL